MRPIPPKLRLAMSKDPYYSKCCRADGNCSGRITWEHAIIYNGKQVNEIWAIIPLCFYHHLGEGLNKRQNILIALQRATPEELAKYRKRDWNQEAKTQNIKLSMLKKPTKNTYKKLKTCPKCKRSTNLLICQCGYAIFKDKKLK